MRTNVTRCVQFALQPSVSVLVSCVGLAMLVELENQYSSVPFVVMIIGFLASIAFFLTSRFAFSVYAAWAVAGIVTLVSLFKFKTKGFSLHFYDLVFVGGDPTVYAFLVGTFPKLVLSVLALALVISGGFVLAFSREERRQVGLGPRIVLVAITAAALPLTLPAQASNDQRYFYYLGGHHASSFFVSLLDFEYFFSRTEALERLARMPPETPLAQTPDCRVGEGKPDVFVVLQESQTDLALLPQLGLIETDKAPATGRFGRKHPLSVETFGGGTWITNLSLMTGLSAADFGWRSPYLTITLEGMVGGALPQVLAQCGYRTAAILPMTYSFVNEGPFLHSIGFETVLDAKAIGATDFIHRDSLYFEAAEQFIAEHRATDDRPLFLLVQTMFPHAPYTSRMDAAAKVTNEPLHAEPELAEYLRRVALSRADFGIFMSAREADPSPRGSVVLEFGDHQSYATKPFIDELAGPDSLSDLSSLAYRTYFALRAFGYDLQPPGRNEAPMDVAFLGAHLVERARLPSSPILRDLSRLRALCDGRFHTCDARDEIDRHLRRRIDAGLLDILDEPAQGGMTVAQR
ncbi:sulfatase-like hydrolase/transferase [Fulvimarina sp. 2208YS6-2-32]|uniref:Sulfatase-like hydrolase/transferase n=1 Tax=Fulvimarina uroteuthidis TaxID=3098149 RepID=A0ABU5I4A3_9HYPH|nr:sulfatase-like hydrolase/transferase [Fulvimarina sp. 2208YS6-2-32]MDY8110203.1 sulfatase-like hydrolase/transferase [Fulvimarina sp. 2208YS6-2-32]